MLKGLALRYPFLLIVAIIFILVVASFIHNVFNKAKIPQPGGKVDVRYACSVYNDSSIGYEELRVILYGFRTGQCSNFVAKLEESATLDDVERAVGKKAVRLERCELPSVNSGSFYVFMKGDRFDNGIFIRRREMKNGDIILCEL